MKNKIGRLLKRTAYGFYTLGVFFLIVGMLLSSVTQPALASGDQQLETTEEVWDKSSLSFTGSCEGDCTEVRATVCNGQDSGAMEGTTTYQVFYNASGEPKDGTQVESGTIRALDPGECVDLTYKTKNVAGNYGFHFDQRPGHPGNNEMNAHWSDTCTVSACPTTATLIVKKFVVNNYEGEAVSSDFTMTVTGNGASPSSFFGSEGGTSVTLNPGDFSVRESGPTGYTGSSEGCSGEIAAGETKTCVFTNTDLPITPENDPAYLTVIKHVINDGGGLLEAEDFTITVTADGSEVDKSGGSETGKEYEFEPGDGVINFSVTEEEIDGYQASYDGCEGTLEEGDDKTCTITNTYIPDNPEFDPAYLTVIKHVINDNGGTLDAEDFSITVSAGEFEDVINGSEEGVEFKFEPGEGSIGFSVTETEVAGYAASYDGCEGTLEEGDDKTCTITNDDIPATLTVIKQVVNDDGGEKAPGDFMMFVTNNGAPFTSFEGVSEGKTINIDAGTYNVTESEVGGYIGSIGGTCSGTLALGESATCTIVNDDIPSILPPGNAKLTVIKVVEGGTKVVADFPLAVNGKQVVSGVTNQYLPGSYVVSETSDPNYKAKFSGDCNGQGAVTLAEGDDKTCTITNTYKAPVVTPHTEDPTPQATLPAPQGTPSQGDPLIPVTGADLSHPGFPAAALPRLALNLGIALLGLAMVFHGASSRFKDEE